MESTGRRVFLKALAGAAAAALPSFGRGRSGDPNIVFILADDLGWADLPCYGNAFNEAPNLDRLAREGMRFTDAYAAGPVCSPTRASILSGQYPARCGITDFIPGYWLPYEKLRTPLNRQSLPLEAVTLAEAMKPAGYACGMFGKWHLGGKPFYPDRQGFDAMLVSSGWGHFLPPAVTDPKLGVPEGSYLAEVLTERAERFLEENRRRPFFLLLNHFAVHIPLEARNALIEKYQAKPRPASGVNNPVYAAMVEHVDASVGRIVRKLDELGLADDTVVVFFSDNGGLYRETFVYKEYNPTTNTPLRSEKGSLYEGGIRVPLVVRWPGTVKPGSLCREPVSSVDFYPTFLEMAGLDPPFGHPLDGRSLLSLWKEKGRPKRDAIYWHYPHYHHTSPAGAIRRGDWKLIEFFEDGRLELYHVREDMSERRNLAGVHPERAAGLRKKLAEWRVSVNADMPEPNPDYDPARRMELGRHP